MRGDGVGGWGGGQRGCMHVCEGVNMHACVHVHVPA